MTMARRINYHRNDNRCNGSSPHNLHGLGSAAAVAVVVVGLSSSSSSSWSWRLVSGFVCSNMVHTHHGTNLPSSTTLLRIFAPPGSGYVRSSVVKNEDENDNFDRDDDDDDDSQLLTSRDIARISPKAYPNTYEPMLEYPGTMRPGRTPENMPYHDLPFLNVDDPNPVPWPHFQEIEWHHKWEPPHEQAMAMEEFIEDQGRWASVEDEAEMRMGMRRGVRERREMEEAGGISGTNRSVGGGGVMGSNVGGEQMVIMDDDDDDDEEEEDDEDGGMGARSGGLVGNLGLGDGVKAFLKNAADTASTTRRSALDEDDSEDDLDEDIDDVEDILGDDEGEDDFLLDLGLGGDVGDVGIDDDEDILAEEEEETFPTKSAIKMEAKSYEEDDEGDDIDLEENLDLGFELGFDLDEEEDVDNVDDDDDEEDFGDFDDDDDDMSLDDYTKEDDVGDDDVFDDGGFDYGDDAAY